MVNNGNLQTNGTCIKLGFKASMVNNGKASRSSFFRPHKKDADHVALLILRSPGQNSKTKNFSGNLKRKCNKDWRTHTWTSHLVN